MDLLSPEEVANHHLLIHDTERRVARTKDDKVRQELRAHLRNMRSELDEHYSKKRRREV